MFDGNYSEEKSYASYSNKTDLRDYISIAINNREVVWIFTLENG